MALLAWGVFTNYQHIWRSRSARGKCLPPGAQCCFCCAWGPVPRWWDCSRNLMHHGGGCLLEKQMIILIYFTADSNPRKKSDNQNQKSGTKVSQVVDNKPYHFLFHNFTVKMCNYVGAWTRKHCSWLMAFSTDFYYRGAARKTAPQQTAGLPSRKRDQSVQQTGNRPEDYRRWFVLLPSLHVVSNLLGPIQKSKRKHNMAS